LHALAEIGDFSVKDIFANLTAIRPPPPSVFSFGIRAAIFGHNAPEWKSLPVIQRIGEYSAKKGAADSPDPPLVFVLGPYADRESTWVDSPSSLANYPGEPSNTGNIYLDNIYPTIVKGSWVVLKDGQNARAYQVDDVAEVSKSDFTLTAKVTRLTLSSSDGLDKFTIRNTTVFGQSEELPLARKPIAAPVSGEIIDLNELVEHLYTDQKIIVCGEKADDLGVRACEVAIIDKADQNLEIDGSTRITLRNELTNSYVRDTVTINANVALATHGETVEEVLGGGDATVPYQTFTLRQPPLTYVGADTPSGHKTTLEVRVNDLLWREVPSFHDHAPEERIYVTRIDEDGKTTVMFGDGTTGARLPTGLENVKAKYRKGIGLGGLVKADQLTQLMTRPLGLKGATNPLAAAGAADPERVEDARRNAPLTVLTLDRIVSLRDYEDFARAFAGIEKALATWTWFGEKRGVFVTVAGPEGAKIEDGSELQKNLLKAMRQAGDPRVPLLLKSYQLGLFQISALVKVASEFLTDKVLTEVEQKLRGMFSFESRAFGQAVHLSEVIGAMQSVGGVVAVDVNEFYRSDEPVGLKARIPAAVPQSGGNELTAAELLILDPRPVRLGVLT
jgi:predicted phage baseplate assembly protein